MCELLNHRLGAASTRYAPLRRGLALGTLLVMASACGGRWRTVTTTPDDDSSDSGGAIGIAGASPAHAGASGASTGQAGGNGGGAGSAGTSCNNVGCPDIGCADGSIPVTPAGQCCPVCQTVCKQVCQACAPGTTPQTHVGACCPDCVPTISCAAGQMTYQDVRTTASYKFAFGCGSDAECAVVAPANSCESGCPTVAIVKNEVDSFTEYLKGEADQDCAGCAQGAVQPCEAPTVHCYGGQCAFSQP